MANVHQQNAFVSQGASGNVWKLLDLNPRVVKFQSVLDPRSDHQVHVEAPANNLSAYRRSADN